MSDASDIHVLLKPEQSVAKRTVTGVAIAGGLTLPLVLLFDADVRSSPQTLFAIWGIVMVIWLGTLIVHYWVLLRDEHGVLFAQGNAVYERENRLLFWRHSKKLLECGPGNSMEIEVAEAFHPNEHTYGVSRPSERVDIRLSNGSKTAEITPLRRDVEDGWNHKFHCRFDEWQQSVRTSTDHRTNGAPFAAPVSAPMPSAKPTSAPTAAAPAAAASAPAESPADTEYPLLKPNTEHIKRHMFWAALRWIGGLVVTWLILMAILLLVSQSDAMASFALFGVPVILLFGCVLVLRYYHRVGHDSKPMLFGTEDAVYRRAGGMFRARYSKVMLERVPGQPMDITRISRLGLEEWDRDTLRSWWNLRALIKLSNGTETATWRSPLFLVEENWRVRFRRRFETWQNAVAPGLVPDPATDSTND